jgi:hydrogenase/urease accessory protein HupE
MNPRQLFPLLTAAVVLGLGPLASAHPGHSHPGEGEVDEFELQGAFRAGLRDPFRSWERILPVLAIGCSAGVAGRRRGPVVTAFAASLAAGGIGSLSGLALSGSATMATAAAAASLALTVTRGRLATGAAVVLAGLAGFSQGNAEAFKVPLHELLLAYGAGWIAICSGLLVAGMAAGRLLRNTGPWGAALSPIVAR